MAGRGGEAVAASQPRADLPCGDPVMSTGAATRTTSSAVTRSSVCAPPRTTETDESSKRPGGVKSPKKKDTKTHSVPHGIAPSGYSVIFVEKERCPAKRTIKETEGPAASCEKIKMVRVLADGAIVLPPMAPPPPSSLPAQPVVGATRPRLSRVRTRLRRCSDGQVEAAAPKLQPIEDQMWRRWENCTEKDDEEDEEAFACQGAQLKWSANVTPRRRKPESAEDDELGLSTLSLSAGMARGISKVTHKTGGAPAAPTPTITNLSDQHSARTGPARVTAQHVANLTAYTKTTFGHAASDAKLKHQARLRTQQAAFAARETVDLATRRCHELDEQLTVLRERTVKPAEAKLVRARHAWTEGHDKLSRAEEIAKTATSTFAEAQKSLHVANEKFSSAWRAEGDMWAAVSQNSVSPGLGMPALLATEHTVRALLAAARTESEIAQARVRSARAAAVDASRLVEVEIVEGFFLGDEIDRATTAYKGSLALCEKLETKIRVARGVEKAAKEDARDAKKRCILPYQEYIAALNRLERTRETHEVLLAGAFDENAPTIDRPDTHYGGGKGSGDGGGSSADEHAAGTKRKSDVGTEGECTATTGEVRRPREISENSSQDSVEEGGGRGLKRIRNLGIFVA